MTPPPKLYPSAAVKVRLLQDAIYAEDAELWATLLRYRSHIDAYFREIALDLVVHEDDGFAYLKQGEDDEQTVALRLFRHDRLTKGVAIVGLILREQLLHFDESLHDETRLTIRRSALLQLTGPFFPESNDKIRDEKKLDAIITKAEELGFLRTLASDDDDDLYEVRRIVKARFPVELLKELREALLKHIDDQG